MTTLYLATTDGPIIAAQAGEQWRATLPLQVGSVSCIAADPRRPERVFCGTARDGAWRSDNAGQDWQRVFPGLPHQRITSLGLGLGVSRAETADGYGVVYLGTEPSALFRSQDGGASWRECAGMTDLPSAAEWSFPPRPETHHVRWIEADPPAAGRLYVAIEAGALIGSPDGGQSWRDRVAGGPWDTHQLATHPQAPGRLWSAAGDGFFESDDHGASWRKSEDGLGFRYCWSIAVDRHDPATALLTAAPGPRQAHTAEQAESAVFRRTDDGPWQEVGVGLPEAKGCRAPLVAVDPAAAGVFYCAAEAGLYRSADAGASWERLAVQLPLKDAKSRVHALAVVDAA